MIHFSFYIFIFISIFLLLTCFFIDIYRIKLITEIDNTHKKINYNQHLIKFAFFIIYSVIIFGLQHNSFYTTSWIFIILCTINNIASTSFKFIKYMK